MLEELTKRLVATGRYNKRDAEKAARRIVVDSSLKRHKVQQFALGGSFTPLPQYQFGGLRDSVNRIRGDISQRRLDRRFPNEGLDGFTDEELNQYESTPDFVAPSEPIPVDMGSLNSDDSFDFLGFSNDFNGIVNPNAEIPEDERIQNQIVLTDENFNNQSSLDSQTPDKLLEAPFGTASPEPSSERDRANQLQWYDFLNPYGVDLETSLYSLGRHLGSSPTTRAGKVGKTLGIIGGAGKSLLGGSRSLLSGMSHETARQRYLDWMEARLQRRNYETGRQTGNTSADMRGGVSAS